MLKILITEMETGEVLFDMESNAMIAGFADAKKKGNVHGFTYGKRVDSFVFAGCANSVEKEIHGLFDRNPELEHLANYLKAISETEEMMVDEEVQ